MKKINYKNLLFPVYLIARILKTPLFWIPISNFNRWKREKYLEKDLIILSIFAVGFLIWFFLSGWLFGISGFLFLILVFCLLNFKN